MTLAELETELREDILEDTNSDAYLCSSKQIQRWLNEAVREACVRSHLMQKTQVISVVAGTAIYKLENWTREIEDVNLTLNTQPLTCISNELMPYLYGASWKLDIGMPNVYVRGITSIRLYPIPVANDTMSVVAYTWPETYSKSDEPEIDAMDHHYLLYWAAFKAFSNPDIDLGNQDRAMMYLALFEDHFGKRKSAKYESIVFSTPKYNSVSPRRMC